MIEVVRLVVLLPALAGLAGLLAPSALGIVVQQGFPVAAGLFAALLTLAALLSLRLRVETRGRALG